MLPDTGADVIFIGRRHLDTLHITKSSLHPLPPTTTLTADVSGMVSALGTLQATLTLGKLLCSATIHVCKGAQTTLLSYGHCPKMSIISSAFPKPILEVKHVNRFKVLLLTATTSSSAAKEHFLQEFKEVLVSKEELKLTPLKPMTGPPTRIHLKEDAIPFAIHMPCQISFAFQSQVKEELNSKESLNQQVVPLQTGAPQLVVVGKSNLLLIHRQHL